jgi:hypothetical protein
MKENKRQPETIDGETGKPEAPKRRIDLSNIRDCRLELAALYRRVDAGELDSGEANKRAWLVRQIGDLIVAFDIEKRLEALEEGTPLRPASAPGLPGLRRLN